MSLLSDGLLRRLLLICLLLGAISAFIGGLGLFFGWMHVPESYLERAPFSSYTIPGLILFFVVGGTQLWAAVENLRSSKYGLLWSAVAGFGMQIWIYGEIYFILQQSWLQNFYFVLGTFELMLVLGLLGILPGALKSSSKPDKLNP